MRLGLILILKLAIILNKEGDHDLYEPKIGLLYGE